MGATKTESPQKEISLAATVTLTAGGCGLGELVSTLCNFFMDFTDQKAGAFGAACILAFGFIGFMAGVWLDMNYKVNVPNM